MNLLISQFPRTDKEPIREKHASIFVFTLLLAKIRKNVKVVDKINAERSYMFIDIVGRVILQIENHLFDSE